MIFILSCGSHSDLVNTNLINAKIQRARRGMLLNKHLLKC